MTHIQSILECTQGIALVRPAPLIGNVDITVHLRRQWKPLTPSIGLVVGNGCEEGIVHTMTGIIGRAPYTTALVDLLPLPTDSVMASVNRLLPTILDRLEMIMGSTPRPKIIVAIIDRKPVLEEIAVRAMIEYGFPPDFLREIARGLARPGDGVVIDRQGNVTDKPLVPRSAPSLLMEMARA